MTASPLFRVTADVFENFPTYIVACVAVRGIDQTSTTERFEELVANAPLRSRATFDGLDLKAQEPFSAWRDAFSTAGWSASRFPASVEAIHKRVQRGDEPPRINAAVDLASSAVLYYAVPVGTHDIHTLDGQPLVVRHATSDDTFVAMNGDAEAAHEGEIVYAAGTDIRTRRWVWRQGRNGLVAESASDLFFPIDGFADRTYDAVVAAQNYLAEVCATELGADVATALVTSDNREFFID